MAPLLWSAIRRPILFHSTGKSKRSSLSFFIRMHEKHIYRLILAVILALCYSVTMAPGLSWANGGADGGDLIAAAATNGVAHPSGYPLYLLLARVFQLIP